MSRKTTPSGPTEALLSGPYEGYAEPDYHRGYVVPRRLQDYYYFLQAFELYGERFFPEWDIREYCQRECPDRSAERTQHTELSHQFKTLSDGFAQLAKERFKLSLSQAEKDTLDEERQRLLSWYNPLKTEIDRLHYFTQEHAIAEEARWLRKCATLDALLGALRSGELIAQLWGDGVLRSHDWHPNSHNRLILPMSYLAQRKEFFGGNKKPFPRRRGSAVLDRAIFDRWLRRQTAQNKDAYERLSRDDQLQIRAEQFLLDTDPRPTKEEFRVRMKETCDSTKGEANRLWDLYAPREARLAGRKSTQKTG